jgi:hypothetical protein
MEELPTVKFANLSGLDYGSDVDVSGLTPLLESELLISV